MGRLAWSWRNTVEECRAIDVFWLYRNNYFCGFNSGTIYWRNSFGETISSIGVEVSTWRNDPADDYIRFHYTLSNFFSDKKKSFDYRFRVVTTPCNIGDLKYWFICGLTTNGRYCGRRVAKLYLPPNGEYFGCRHCHDLTYRCQKEHDKRLDWLRSDPNMLVSYLKSDKLSKRLLAIRASIV